MHITLKFLGETPHDRIPQLTKLIADAVAGVKSRELPLRGLGAFPNTTRPAVAWAAIHEAEELVSIAARIDSFLEPEGFAREGRAYTPHLTLARVRALRDGSRERIPDGVLELLQEHGATDFGSVPMNEVVFYKSTLSDSGPTYERLATFALDNSGRV